MVGGGPKGAQVLRKEDGDPQSFKWIALRRITWQDDRGRVRQWEAAERTTTSQGAADAVAVFAKVKIRGRPPLIPVVVQFRPAVGRYCIELPAGLIDAGETVAQAALRELREETGLTGTVVEEGVSSVTEPGLTNSSVAYVIVEVDADAPENQRPDQHCRRKDQELIHVRYLPWHNFVKHLLALRRQHGWSVDSRLLTYAVGLEHGKAVAARMVDHSSLNSSSASVTGQASMHGRHMAAMQNELPQPLQLRARL